MSRQLKDDNGYSIPQVFELDGATVISVSGTSQQSAAFASTTTAIRIAVTNHHVHFAINSNPVATTSSSIIPKDWVETIAVRPGHKLAVIQGSGAGQPIISITELV
jgi:hypothetical protein